MGTARVSGVTIPLFSVRTRADWGIGQITDLPAAAGLFLRAGQSVIQVLPTHELADGETSPYGALSAFALDPIYITVEATPEVDAELLSRALGDTGRAELDRLRGLPTVDYAAVRTLKRRVLGQAFARFSERELGNDTQRARDLFAFVEDEGAWLRDHALYAALRASHAGYGWSTWPAHERDRSPEVLRLATSPRDDGGLGTQVLEEMYLQWIAHEQWRAARREMKRAGVSLMGDMPFIVGRESADIWAHRDQFQADVSLGAPPDDFSADGQSWGLPAYDWPTMDADDLGWIRARAAHCAELFDRFRIDHVVGFFRQWIKRDAPPDAGRGRFDPEGEVDQRARGEKVLRAMLEAAGQGTVIAEDLGVIPPFVRETMTRLGLPGYKVLPWERDENFIPRDPRQFPELSVATWSTHDTLPITQWWYELEHWERERLAHLDKIPLDLPEQERELALIRLLFSARSELTLLLAQEILGDKTRINLPGTVTAQNWTWRLPRPIEDLLDDPVAMGRLAAIRGLAIAAGRFSEA
ncbi:MAG TPA: 4-alpha-glucanotransferase [Labilithrix sp.]|nr:4-alpha-glucanotransferase [Labilithrix sp.]